MKRVSITAIIEESLDGWFVGQIEEFPEVISQGKSIDELKENLMDALKFEMQMRREKTQQQYLGRKTICRKITFA